MTHSHRAKPRPARTRPLDLDTVVTVLYISALTRTEWELMGPELLARYVRTITAQPRFRVPEMVVLLRTVRRVVGVPSGVAADHLADCVEYAPAVLAAATR